VERPLSRLCSTIRAGGDGLSAPVVDRSKGGGAGRQRACGLARLVAVGAVAPLKWVPMMMTAMTANFVRDVGLMTSPSASATHRSARLVPAGVVASTFAVPALPAGVVALIVVHHDAGRCVDRRRRRYGLLGVGDYHRRGAVVAVTR
jgi:hypothetical protein